MTAEKPVGTKTRHMTIVSRGEHDVFIRIVIKTQLGTKIRREEDIYQVSGTSTQWGIAAIFRKVVGKQRPGITYHVVLGDHGNEQGPTMCNCVAFEKTGACRHVDALRSLVAKGEIK